MSQANATARPSASPRRSSIVGLARATTMIVINDLRLERRTGELFISSGLLALLVVLLMSLSLYIDADSGALLAPGVIWVAIAFSGTLAMSRSWGRDLDQGVLPVLLRAPVPPTAIYMGKVIATWLITLTFAALLVPITAMLFHVAVVGNGLTLVVICGLGTLGFVATGNLFAALSARTGARDVVLSLIVFPLVTPALLASVVATRQLLGGAAPDELFDWVRVLIAFDTLSLGLGTVLFGQLIRD